MAGNNHLHRRRTNARLRLGLVFSVSHGCASHGIAAAHRATPDDLAVRRVVLAFALCRIRFMDRRFVL